MPFSWRLTDDDRVLVTDYHGDLTGAELLAAQAERSAAMVASGRVRCLLNDFSRTRSLDLRMEVILDHAARTSSQRADYPPDLHIAFVVPEALAYGIARMWAVRVQQPDWRVELFVERAAAEAWLRRESGSALAFA